MASKLTDLWEKKASHPIEGIAKKSGIGGGGVDTTSAPEMNKLAKRRTLEIEKAISADRKATAELAKASSASYTRRNTGGDNKENQPARKISFAGSTKTNVSNVSNDDIGRGDEKKEIQDQIAEVRKMLKNALAVIDDLAARVDEM